MKKAKIFVAAIAFCGAALVGYNAYSNATMTEQERLIQQNLEALTNTETGTAYWQTMARCGTGTMQWSCTTVVLSSPCKMYVCLETI